MNTILNKMPDVAPEGPIDTKQKGLLSPIGDGLGQVLDKGLKPVGAITGGVAGPAGEALQNVEGQAKEEVGTDNSRPGGESIGGQAQSAGNPLGL